MSIVIDEIFCHVCGVGTFRMAYRESICGNGRGRKKGGTEGEEIMLYYGN